MSEEATEQDSPKDEDQVSKEDIERATRQGWVEKEQFHGNPEDWVDAKTFLQRGEEMLPVMRANYKKLEQKVREQEESMRKFVEFQKGVDERAYKKALDDIRKQKADAVEAGDKEAFTRAEQEEDELRQQQSVKQSEPKPAENPEWAAWAKENPWYFDDEEAGAYADAISIRVQKTHPHLTGRDFYDAVKAKVRQRMPEKFGNPRRAEPAAVEAGSSNKRKTGGKTYADLPTDAKKACDDFVKNIPGYTKEQYLKDYDWSAAQ